MKMLKYYAIVAGCIADAIIFAAVFLMWMRGTVQKEVPYERAGERPH